MSKPNAKIRTLCRIEHQLEQRWREEGGLIRFTPNNLEQIAIEAQMLMAERGFPDLVIEARQDGTSDRIDLEIKE